MKSKQHFPLGDVNSHTIALKKRGVLKTNGLKETFNKQNVLQAELDPGLAVKRYHPEESTFDVQSIAKKLKFAIIPIIVNKIY